LSSIDKLQREIEGHIEIHGQNEMALSTVKQQNLNLCMKIKVKDEIAAVQKEESEIELREM